MNALKHIALLLMTLSIPAHADIFKCKLASGKTVYQPSPCSSASTTQAVVKVKEEDPQETKEAEEKLKAWKEEFAVREAAEIEAEKERQIELDRKESLEIQRRSAIAQEQQAIAAQQRQEQENRVLSPPLYNNYPWINGYPHSHDDNHPHSPPYRSNVPRQPFFSSPEFPPRRR